MLAVSVGDVIWLRSQTTGLLASWTVGGPIFNAPGPYYTGLTNLGDGSVPLVIGGAYDVGFIATGAASFDAVINAGASTDNDVIVPSPDPIILRDGNVPTTTPLTVSKLATSQTDAAIKAEHRTTGHGIEVHNTQTLQSLSISSSHVGHHGETSVGLTFGGGDFTATVAPGSTTLSGRGSSQDFVDGGLLRILGGPGGSMGTPGDGGDVTIDAGIATGAANGSILVGLQSPTEIEFGQGFTVGETDNHPVPAVGGKGQFWARSSDGKPIFTDSSGIDLDLAAAGAGDVVGPGAATDNSVALFDTTSGKLLKDGVALGTSGQVLTSGGAGVPPAFATVAGTGDVVGPGSAIDNSVPLFDTTTGKLLKDGVALGTSGQVLTSGGAGVPPSFEDAGIGAGSLDAVITGGTPDNDVNIPSTDPIIFKGLAAGDTPLSVSKAFASTGIPVVSFDANGIDDVIASFGNLSSNNHWKVTARSIKPGVSIGPFEFGDALYTGVPGTLSLIGTGRIDEGDGGEVVIEGGRATSATSGDGGDIDIRGGTSVSGTVGDIILGASTTAAVRVGATGTDIEIIDSTGSNGAPGQVLGSDGTFALWGSAGAGDVVGPGPSVTGDAVARFDGTGGLTIQESPVIIGDTGNVTGVLDITAETVTTQSGAELTEYAEYGIAPYASRVTQFTIGGVPQTGTVIEMSILGMGSAETGLTGGTVNMFAGNASVGNADGGDLNFSGGASAGSGTMGKVVFEGSEVQLLNVPLTTNSTIDGIDIATDVAANTSKVSNANHSGDVTGDTALTIADNVVTVAKMAPGTAGALIVYDGGGNPVDIGVGSASDVLTSNAGAIPTWEAAGAPGAHTLGGASHTADSLADLNTKVDDATLDDVGDPRDADNLLSATTTIDISSATAPSTDQVLTATSSTAATWQTPSGGTPATTVTTSDTSAGVVGTDTEYARQDHKHQVLTGTADGDLTQLEDVSGTPGFAAGIDASQLVNTLGIAELEGFVRKTGTDTYESIKTNMSASAEPSSATDDETLGYAIGSRWLDLTNLKEYVCMDATDGFAVWVDTAVGLHAATHSAGAADELVLEDFGSSGMTIGHGARADASSALEAGIVPFVVASASEPSTPNVGDIWIETS
jgi:hypothetical protein